MTTSYNTLSNPQRVSSAYNDQSTSGYGGRRTQASSTGNLRLSNVRLIKLGKRSNNVTTTAQSAAKHESEFDVRAAMQRRNQQAASSLENSPISQLIPTFTGQRADNAQELMIDEQTYEDRMDLISETQKQQRKLNMAIS